MLKQELPTFLIVHVAPGTDSYPLRGNKTQERNNKQITENKHYSWAEGSPFTPRERLQRKA